MRRNVMYSPRSVVLAGLAMCVLSPVPHLQAASAVQSGSIVGIKRLRSSDDTKKPRKVKRETPYVQICTGREISEQPPYTENCQAAQSGDDLLWGEGLRVERLARARVLLPLAGITEPFVFLPRLFTATGAALWAPTESAEVERGSYELSRQGEVSILDVLSGALIAVDHDAAKLKRAGLRIRAAGVVAESEHTTWFLGLSGAGEATLVVDSGAVMISPDALAPDSLRPTWGQYAERVLVEQGSTATWSLTSAPSVTQTQNTQVWHEAIRYSGDSVWEDGGFPWVVVPAVAVPVVLCAIFCNDIFDGDGDKTGTVTIPIP
jgi:hypothetical protein